MNTIDALQAIKSSYGNHPCGMRFCRKCRAPMIPPAYLGDYWDCTKCENTLAPSNADMKKMYRKVH